MAQSVAAELESTTMSSALTRFGILSRAIRSSHDRSMGEQAEALGCAVHSISDIETGKTSPSDEYIESFCRWLDLPKSQLDALKKRSKSNVVNLKGGSFSNNSSSMRLFRKISKMDSTQIIIVRSDEEMSAIDGAEAYTSFNPPLIAVRESVYALARRNDGRARMTFAHEFGHLVLHPGAAKLRAENPGIADKQLRPFESAEWQARKFAAFFLLPDYIVRQFSSPRELSAGCQVSFQAAEIRFEEVGHIRRTLPKCVSELAQNVAGAPRSAKPTLVKR